MYAISVRIPGDTVQAFTVFVPDLGADTQPDLGAALEIPNGGLSVGPEGGEVLYLIDGAAPRLTRFEYDREGQLHDTGRLSLEGISPSSNSAAAGNFVFLSETRAYVIDTLAQVLVSWDPSALEIRGTLDLSDTAEAGRIAVIAGQPRFRGQELVFALAYVDLGSAFGPDSKLVFVDTGTDTLTRVVDVPDCAALSDLVITDTGDLYAASSVANVFNRLGGLSEGNECLVRVPVDTYDPEPVVALSSRTAGQQGGSLLQQRDSLAYIRLLDEALVPSDALDLGDFNSAAAWRWARLDLAGTEDAKVVSALEPQSGSTRGFSIDGRTWAVEMAPNFERSSLLDLGSEQPQMGIAVPGIIINAFRMR